MEKKFSLQIEVMKQQMQKRLDAEGIDITRNDYRNNENYSKIKDEVWCIGPEGAITVESFIDRYFIGEHRLPHTYDSPYDMGNTADLNQTSPNNETVYINLSKMDNVFIPLGNQIAKDLGMEEDEIRYYATAFHKKTYKNRGRERTGGLGNQLKQHINFDIRKFDINDEKNKREIFKIIRFFHLTKKREKTNILAMLSDYSMENVDNTFFDWPTFNGKHIRNIKNEIAKEVSPEMVQKIKNARDNIVWEWNCTQRIAAILEDVANSYHLDSFLDKITLILKEVPQRLDEANNHEYLHSPMETLYLIILQLEQRGIIKDIEVVNDEIEKDYVVPIEYIPKMHSIYKEKLIKLTEVESYIEENVKVLSELVYLHKDITSDESPDEQDEIIKSATEVVKILGFFDKHTSLPVRDTVNKLLIISCLQAIIDSKNKILKYQPYNYGKHGARKPQLEVWKELKRNKLPVDIVQTYLKDITMNHWNANLGRFDVRIRILEFEKVCDNILDRILSRPNLEEMLEIHNYYIAVLKQKLLIPEHLTDIVIPIIKQESFRRGFVLFDNFLDSMLITSERLSYIIANLKRYLTHEGFSFNDIDNKIRYVVLYFLAYPKSLFDTTASFIDKIEKALADKETTVPYSLKDEEAHRELDFQLVFDYEKATCTMTNFNIKYDEQYIKKLEYLGIVVLDL